MTELDGEIDCAIITVREDEFQAILDRLPNRIAVLGGSQFYEYACLPLSDSSSIKVAVTRQLEQGQNAAQKCANSLFKDFKPRWLVLFGIAGGVPHQEFSLGDVVIGTRMHDFSVSAAVEEKKTTFEQMGGPVHPKAEKLLAVLSARTQRFTGWNTQGSVGLKKPTVELNSGMLYGNTSAKKQTKDSIARHFPSGSKPRRPIFRMGPVGTSNTLVKSTIVLNHWLESARMLSHVEMEAGGAYVAAQEANCPLLSIRGISDVVGLKRDPIWTRYACEAGGSFVNTLLRSGLLLAKSEVEFDTNSGSRRVNAIPGARRRSESQGNKTISHRKAQSNADAREKTRLVFWTSESPVVDGSLRYHLGQVYVLQKMEQYCEHGEETIAVICDPPAFLSARSRPSPTREKQLVADFLDATKPNDCQVRYLSDLIDAERRINPDAFDSNHEAFVGALMKIERTILPLKLTEAATAKLKSLREPHHGPIPNEIEAEIEFIRTQTNLSTAAAMAALFTFKDRPAWFDVIGVARTGAFLAGYSSRRRDREIVIVEGSRNSYIWLLLTGAYDVAFEKSHKISWPTVGFSTMFQDSMARALCASPTEARASL